AIGGVGHQDEPLSIYGHGHDQAEGCAGGALAVAVEDKVGACERSDDVLGVGRPCEEKRRARKTNYAAHHAVVPSTHKEAQETKISVKGSDSDKIQREAARRIGFANKVLPDADALGYLELRRS